MSLEEIESEEEYKKTLIKILNEILDYLDDKNPTQEELRLEVIDDIYRILLFNKNK